MTDNRIAFLDHVAFLRLRATGVDTVGQVTWIYDRPVDLEGCAGSTATSAVAGSGAG
ncbi:hypothetical protein I545_5560 [Mycobacterium kansasii 662]|uniref:Uncharacterized protein n=1 Tax=Mycobacterium kansasii 662 TaxID=1299326 RepID=X7YX76_MYCKA|nr:hypothetical protein I545_5560 [Mycobacterium kansasii 662]